jgi:hypothetical protein
VKLPSPAALRSRAADPAARAATAARAGADQVGGGYFDRATRLYLAIAFRSWNTAMLLLIAGMLVSFLLFGLFWPYWRVTDQDLILAYQGLLYNDNLPQEYFDHTGYLYDLALSAWYLLLHAIGLLPVHALSELPAPVDVGAFDTAWQHLIEAGRTLSLVIGAAFVWTFAVLMRELIGDWRIASLSGFGLAFSSGIAMHVRVMRTELLSSALVTSALLLALVAARRPGGRRFVMIAAAGLCASLAIVTKVQALFPAVAIPMIALAFGEFEGHGTAGWRGTPAGWRRAVVWCVLAAAPAIPAFALIRNGIATIGDSIVINHAVPFAMSGQYQVLLAALLLVLIGVYAGIWRTPVPDAVAATAAVTMGVAFGLLSLDIRYNPQNVIAVVNPIEHMLAAAVSSNQELAGRESSATGALAVTLAKGVLASLAKHSFVFQTSHRPSLLLEWLAIAGAIVAWRRGDRLLPLQVALLIGAAWGIDAVSALRGLKLAYFAYTDPLLIIAAALVAAGFPQLHSSFRVQKRLFALAAVYLVWAHAAPVQATFSRRPAQYWCFVFPVETPRVHFPFCAP